MFLFNENVLCSISFTMIIRDRIKTRIKTVDKCDAMIRKVFVVFDLFSSLLFMFLNECMIQ